MEIPSSAKYFQKEARIPSFRLVAANSRSVFTSDARAGDWFFCWAPPVNGKLNRRGNSIPESRGFFIESPLDGGIASNIIFWFL
jgi:hypothetical protein